MDNAKNYSLEEFFSKLTNDAGDTLYNASDFYYARAFGYSARLFETPEGVTVQLLNTKGVPVVEAKGTTGDEIKFHAYLDNESSIRFEPECRSGCSPLEIAHVICRFFKVETDPLDIASKIVKSGLRPHAFRTYVKGGIYDDEYYARYRIDDKRNTIFDIICFYGLVDGSSSCCMTALMIDEKWAKEIGMYSESLNGYPVNKTFDNIFPQTAGDAIGKELALLYDNIKRNE